MVDVDSLSDAELRTKLLEFGFPVMPITGTTRKIMVKKLKILLENKNNSSNSNRRSLGRYSSEEDSDTDVKITKKDKNRRVTMAAPQSSNSINKTNTTLRKTLRHNNSDDAEMIQLPVTKDVTKTKTVTSTKTIKTVQDDFDTGSDSEPEIVENDLDMYSKISNSYEDNKESPVQSSFSPSSPFRFNQQSTYSSTKATDSLSNLSSPSYSNKAVSSSRYTSYSNSNPNDALDRLNQIRSRLSLGNPAYSQPIYTSSPVVDHAEDKVETPFLSNFTRRLSQLSSNNPKPEYDFKNDIIKEHDTNGGGYGRSYIGRTTRFRNINRDFYLHHDKNNMVPIAVLVIACLFFLVVGVMYYGMHTNDHAIETFGIQRCSKSQPHLQPGIHCIHDDDIEGAINLLKILKPDLTKRSIAYVCNSNQNVKSYMSEQDIVNYYSKITGQDSNQIQGDLYNLEVLIFKNPIWGISIAKVDESNNPNESNICTDMEDVVKYRELSEPVGLIVFHPGIPWRCSIYNKLHAIFNVMVFLLGVFFVVCLINLLYKYITHYQSQRKQEVFKMVEQIIDTLQANSDNENFLVINHVRDMILPITERKYLEKTWQEAVNFIKENDSRVRTEVQVVQGEPFEVWRWLGNPNLNNSGSPRMKTWQGQAFETQTGAVNSLPCSPTPCLKIRGMAENAEESDYNTIREAVLNKCANKCRILHCSIDNVSKCVYLKCADQADAAVAYTNLHGWWYAGHLVTVKYLRLERYMQRFPKSPASGPPFLKPYSIK